MKRIKRKCNHFNCPEQGEFIIDDMVTSGNIFCYLHIGEHLHYCVEGFEETLYKLKRVTLSFEGKEKNDK